MSTASARVLGIGTAVAVLFWAASATGAEEGRFGFGEPAGEEAIAGWNIDVPPSGEGLPEGRGSVSEGEQVYANKCASCHGQKGEGGPMDRLVGGRGSLDTDKPAKTVGSYWPHATTFFDYVHRAMPFNNPQSLTADELYAVTAYVLHLNEILPADATLDQDSLPKVEMPNRGGFIPDPRPDTSNVPCLECAEK